MSVSINIKINQDTAWPALAELMKNTSLPVLQAHVGPAVADLQRRHYLTLPPNKTGGRSTHFWQQASDAVRWERAAYGVTVVTNKTGVRQRLEGGTIRAINAKNLAIPANALAYGKSPSEFDNLHFVQFGRGADAPKALVTTVDKNVATRKGGVKASTGPIGPQLAMVVMFWLKKEVYQAPNRNVIPSDEQFFTAVTKALEPLLK